MIYDHVYGFSQLLGHYRHLFRFEICHQMSNFTPDTDIASTADKRNFMKPELLHFLFSFQQVCDKFSKMMPNNIRTMRMTKEILDLTRNPPHGITCWPKNDRNDLLEASMLIDIYYVNQY